jgi:hypothetical protein
MRYFLFAFVFSYAMKAQVQGQTQHCGYDFTSYLVLTVHEEGANKNIKGLKVSLVDLDGKEIINTNNQYSWKDNNKELVFSFNYMIDENNQRIEQAIEGVKERWFFPYAKDNYFLSIVNTFPADQIKVKIEDVDGDKNGGYFETQLVELGYFDLFVLCSNQIKDYTVQFGRKANKPLEVILKKL